MRRMDLAVTCFSCGTETAFEGAVSREVTCEQCGAYLHCCRNCQFYDPSAYNECREPMAERVVDKEAANFCDYFKASAERDTSGVSERVGKEALEKLFKKE